MMHTLSYLAIAGLNILKHSNYDRKRKMEILIHKKEKAVSSLIRLKSFARLERCCVVSTVCGVEPAVDKTTVPIGYLATECCGNKSQQYSSNNEDDNNPNHLGNVLITGVVRKMCLKGYKILHECLSPFMNFYRAACAAFNVSGKEVSTSLSLTI
jgi:hypothetical protein